MPDVFVLRRPGFDDLGPWTVAGLFNWTGDAQDRELDRQALGLDPAADYWVSEFWDGEHRRLGAGEPLRLTALPPHGAHLLALRPVRPGVPELVASSFHFSQGGEVTRWVAGPGRLEATIDLGRVAEGEWRLALPGAPTAVLLDNQPLAATDLGQGVYSLRLAVNRQAPLTVLWA